MHILAKLAEAIAQLTLASAELPASLAFALALLLAATTLALLPLLTLLAPLTALSTTALALLTLLALLALLPLLTFTFLAFVAGLALLAECIVEKLLLAADEVPELVHHLHRLLILLALLTGHAARLELLQQIAELAQHLLRVLA